MSSQAQKIALALLRPNQPMGQPLGQMPMVHPLAGLSLSFGGSADVPSQVTPTGYLGDAAQVLEALKMLRAKSSNPEDPDEGDEKEP